MKSPLSETYKTIKKDFGFEVKTVVRDPILFFIKFGLVVFELLSPKALKSSGIHQLSHAVNRFKRNLSLQLIGHFIHKG